MSSIRERRRQGLLSNLGNPKMAVFCDSAIISMLVALGLVSAPTHWLTEYASR